MKIAIGGDHASLSMKKSIMDYLTANGYEYKDFGTYTEESCDYPKYAFAVAEAVKGGEFDKGILICGTGIGMCIAANKVKGIRCALCHDAYSAKITRKHNDSNVLAMGARVIGEGLALEITAEWLATDVFEGGKHKRRIDLITDYENKN